MVCHPYKYAAQMRRFDEVTTLARMYPEFDVGSSIAYLGSPNAVIRQCSPVDKVCVAT